MSEHDWNWDRIREILKQTDKNLDELEHQFTMMGKSNAKIQPTLDLMFDDIADMIQFVGVKAIGHEIGLTDAQVVAALNIEHEETEEEETTPEEEEDGEVVDVPPEKPKAAPKGLPIGGNPLDELDKE